MAPRSGHRLPENVRVIEAGGRYAIPGLFDMHVHLATPIHFIPARDVSRTSSLIAFGVTSVRDMGSDITVLNAWTDRRHGYGAPVPRIFSCGAMIEATRTFFHGGSFFADTDAEARALVRKEKRDGAVAIKSYFTLPWPLHRAIADEARRHDIPVAAHGMIFREVVMGAVLGRASVEHQLTPIRVYGDVLQLLAKTGTRWCLTIGVPGGTRCCSRKSRTCFRAAACAPSPRKPILLWHRTSRCSATFHPPRSWSRTKARRPVCDKHSAWV